MALALQAAVVAFAVGAAAGRGGVAFQFTGRRLVSLLVLLPLLFAPMSPPASGP